LEKKTYYILLMYYNWSINGRFLVMKRTITLSMLLLFLSCKAGKPVEQKEEAAKNAAPPKATLTLGSYTVNKEVYQKEIIPGFRKYWKARTGQDVVFEESYQASGAQSRAIAAGFEADVAALSLEEDIERLVEEKLVTHDWKAAPHGGFVTNSVVAFALRFGNPRGIKDWEDLAKEGVDVLYPNPNTSGGAMWCVNAIYGAGLKISEKAAGKQDPARARDLLKRIQKRVKVMDKSGRESYTTFERGVGDVAVTYENEILLRQKAGKKDVELVVPPATILIQNPASVVDVYARKHGVADVAAAFVEYLHADEAQRAFAAYGFRPVSEAVAREVKDRYPVPEMLFDIGFLGGWKKVHEEIYGQNGIFSQILTELASQ
jgi:sulfate/thiosulfate-binding protein